MTIDELQMTYFKLITNHKPLITNHRPCSELVLKDVPPIGKGELIIEEAVKELCTKFEKIY